MSAPSDRARRDYESALSRFEACAPWLVGPQVDGLKKLLDFAICHASDDARRPGLDAALGVFRGALNRDFEKLSAELFAGLSSDVSAARAALAAALDEDTKEHLRKVANLVPQSKGESA